MFPFGNFGSNFFMPETCSLFVIMRIFFIDAKRFALFRVSSSRVLLPSTFKKNFGLAFLDLGQSLFPEPPAMITG